MSDSTNETESLIEQAVKGDTLAAERLLMMHRDRLKRMVQVRIDPQLRARVDPSDIVQETLFEGSERLAKYLREQPIPFYPWLRQVAWDQLIKMREKHVQAQKRSVKRETRHSMVLPDESVMQLAQQLVGGMSSPSQKAVRNEMRDRIRSILDEMESHDREVLVMRYLEQLSVTEIAALLELTESGVKSRHRRALMRLTQLLSGTLEED